jgi:hypothetical protein
MSPTRTRRQAVPRHRDRRDVATAIGGATAVVLVTIFMIWLLRPGAPDAPGTGGLASRQPRAAWLVGLTLVAMIGFTWWAVRRQRAWRGRIVIVLLAGWVLLGLGAVLAGFVWPGGLLRHTEAAPSLTPPATTTPEVPTTGPGDTTAPGATTAPAGTETTVAPSATTGGP